MTGDQLGGSDYGSPRFIGLGSTDGNDPIWTPERIKRHEALTEKSDLLGGLYGAAVNLLPSIEAPESLKLVAHCVREVYNRFPDFDGITIPGSQGERNKAITSLEKVWITVADRSDGLEDVTGDAFDPDAQLTIRRSGHLAVDDVVVAERTGADGNRRRMRYFLGADVPGSDRNASRPSENAVRDCVGFFIAHAHVGTKPHQYERAELEQQFRLFERILDLRLQDFLDATDEVAGLLAEANTPRSGTGGTHA